MIDPVPPPPPQVLEVAPSDPGLELWPVERLEQATGLSAAALAAAVQAGRLITVTTTAAGQPPSPPLFPSFFGDPRFDRAQLEAVTLALGARPGPEKLFWFCRRSSALGGRTPLAALAGGDVDAVLALARSLEHPLPLRRRPAPVTLADAPPVARLP
jgi:hypothetical protein